MRAIYVSILIVRDPILRGWPVVGEGALPAAPYLLDRSLQPVSGRENGAI